MAFILFRIFTWIAGRKGGKSAPGGMRMTTFNQLLDSFSLRAAHGAMHTFTFRPGGHAGALKSRDVERILSERGIQIFSRTKIGAGELGFSVRSDQAEWAEYLLCRAGVNLTSPLLNPDHDALLHPKGRKSGNLFDRVMQFLEFF